MGFSSNAVVGVWVGRVDNAPTNNTSGLAAAPIWNAVITAALQGTNPQPFNPPAGIIQQQVCADTGTIYDSTTGCTNVRTEYFVQSQPPPPASQGFVTSVPVDTWTGLKANQFCPDSVVTKTFVNISDPSAVAWLQTPAGAAYATSIGLPNPPQSAPTAECTTSTVLPQVHFTAPTNGQLDRDSAVYGRGQRAELRALPDRACAVERTDQLPADCRAVQLAAKRQSGNLGLNHRAERRVSAAPVGFRDRRRLPL